MRFDKGIRFVKIEEGFDPTTGDYTELTRSYESRNANITDTGTQEQVLVYGGIKEGSLTIRLQGEPSSPFDFIEVGSKRYKVDKRRVLEHKTVYVVSEYA